MACLVPWEGNVDCVMLATTHRAISWTVVQRPLRSADITCSRKDVDSIPNRVVYDRVDYAVNCRHYCRLKRIALTLTVWVGSLIWWLSLQRGRTSPVKKYACVTSNWSSFVSCSVCNKREAQFMHGSNRL